MQTNQPHKTPVPHAQHKAPPPKPPVDKPQADPAKGGRARLLLIIGSAVIGVAVLALIGVNLLVSADWVRDRVASRIKEQTGRVLEVKGSTALLFVPGPRVVITDATFVDPEARAGTADFSVGRLVLDLSLMELLSRQVDSERVVLERPVLTLRLGNDDRPKPDKPKNPNAVKAPNDKPQRDVRLRDVRIEDGTVNIVYDDKGTEKRDRAYRRQFQSADTRRAVDRTRQVRLEGRDGRFRHHADHGRRSPRKAPGEAGAGTRYARHRRALRR